MELTHIKGNTWVLEALEYIPLYKLDDSRCVLMDSGLAKEREELEAALEEHGLTPVVILCSHAHVDHCGNNKYFQEKYGTKVALTMAEAGMCCDILNLKCYRLLVSPNTARAEMEGMVHRPDIILPAVDGPIDVEGATFQVIQTPGHSAGHACFVTPDDVCYAADALLSHERMGAKLPYGLDMALMMESREKLPLLNCEKYIMAHRGICNAKEMAQSVAENQALVGERMATIKGFIEGYTDFTHIVRKASKTLGLYSKRPVRGLYYERNIRFFIELLYDRGEIGMEVRDGGVFYYQIPAVQEENV